MASYLMAPEYDLQNLLPVQGYPEVGYEFEDEDDDEIDLSGIELSGYPEVGFNLNPFAFLKRKPKKAPGRVVVRQPRMVMPAARPSPLASSPIPGAVSAIRATPDRPDGFTPLQLDTLADVAAGSTVTIVAQCQQLFKPMSLVFDPVVAPDFAITSIKCGNQEQLAGITGRMPASAFATTNSQAQLNLQPIPPALALNITVTNISGAPRRLTGAAFGYKFA